MTTFTAQELLDMCKVIHGTARAKGWWVVGEDDVCKVSDEDIEEKIFLVITELAEAFEEYRSSKTNDVLGKIYVLLPGSSEKLYIDDDFKNELAVHKPEGFLVEMADAYIRILDLIGALVPNLDIELLDSNMEMANRFVEEECEYTDHMGVTMCEISRAVLSHGEGDLDSLLRSLFRGLILIETACEDGVPLRDAILMKMAYNEKRQVRHGGKRA
jgi:hypothetical protein